MEPVSQVLPKGTKGTRSLTPPPRSKGQNQRMEDRKGPRSLTPPPGERPHFRFSATPSRSKVDMARKGDKIDNSFQSFRHVTGDARRNLGNHLRKLPGVNASLDHYGGDFEARADDHTFQDCAGKITSGDRPTGLGTFPPKHTIGNGFIIHEDTPRPTGMRRYPKDVLTDHVIQGGDKTHTSEALFKRQEFNGSAGNPTVAAEPARCRRLFQGEHESVDEGRHKQASLPVRCVYTDFTPACQFTTAAGYVAAGDFVPRGLKDHSPFHAIKGCTLLRPTPTIPPSFHGLAVKEPHLTHSERDGIYGKAFDGRAGLGNWERYPAENVWTHSFKEDTQFRRAGHRKYVNHSAASRVGEIVFPGDGPPSRYGMGDADINARTINKKHSRSCGHLVQSERHLRSPSYSSGAATPPRAPVRAAFERSSTPRDEKHYQGEISNLPGRQTPTRSVSPRFTGRSVSPRFHEHTDSNSRHRAKPHSSNSVRDVEHGGKHRYPLWSLYD